MEKNVSRLKKNINVKIDIKTITPKKKNIIVEMRLLMELGLVSPLISFVKAVFSPRFER
jgi:hypothetical protein